MAAKTFTANQVCATQLIASGGQGLTNNLGLAIYSASRASGVTGNVTDTAMFSKVGLDIEFFVSGTTDSRGGSLGGTALFGGDMVVSGNMHIGGDGNSHFIRSALNPTKNFIRFSESETDASNAIIIGANTNYLQQLSTETTINSGKVASDFLVYGTDSSNPKIRVSGSINQVLILSGGAAGSDNMGTATDINFFVSGAIGSRGGATRATSVFGGDLHISGNLTSDKTTFGQLVRNTTGSVSFNWLFPKNNNDRLIIGSNDYYGAALQGASLFITSSEPTFTPTIALEGVTGVVPKTSGKTVQISAKTYSDQDSSAAYQSILIHNVTASRASNYRGLFRGEEEADSSKLAYHSSSFIGIQLAKVKDGLVKTPEFQIYHYDTSGTRPIPILTICSNSNGDQLLIHSGTNSSTDARNPRTWKDTSFFVSGTIGSKGSDVRGTAVFGGDVVISGTLAGGSPLNMGDVDINGNVNITGSLVFSSSNGLTGFGPVILNADNNNLLGLPPAFDLRGGFTGSSLIQGQSALSAGNQRVLILSGGSPGSANEGLYEDVSFYVSGAIASRGGTYKGVSLFGGDLVVSGAMKVENDITMVANKRIYLDGTGISGNQGPFIYGSTSTAYLDGDDNLYLYFDTRMSMLYGSDRIFDINAGNFTWNESGAAGNRDYRIETADLASAFLTDNDANQILIGSNATTAAGEPLGADIRFFVSGTVGTTGTSTAGTSLFSGDVVMSASHYNYGAKYVNITSAAGTYSVVPTDYYIAANCSGAPVTINLPSNATSSGRMLIVNDQQANSNNHTIRLDPNASETINGGANLDITTAGMTVTIINDGAGWVTVSTNQ